MLEPPSDALQKLLFEQHLCTPRDLRRCRRIVLRLARDLPAFDSVWLDALVQSKRLTRFQARLLESPQRDRIAVGPCLLVNRIGGGAAGETYLARPKVGRGECVLKLLRTSDRVSSVVVERLVKLVATLQGFQQPSIVVPHACDRTADQVVLVSRAVEGPHLGELLVRRGRYPAEIVAEIARQLAAGLAALAARNVAHGDIRLANVRLTKPGIAVLVDAGVRPSIDTEITVHSGLAPERYDGTAPELIGTNRPPDIRSDLYALGCLLWQLLAGRPPYPGGDPLGKLASHQTRNIDDVRKWAPDTPPRLAETLRRCTARDPAQRPTDYRELLELLGTPRSSGRRLLSGFRRRFDEPAPIPSEAFAEGRSSRFRKAVVAMLLLVACGAVVLHRNPDLREDLLGRIQKYRDQFAARNAPVVVQQQSSPGASKSSLRSNSSKSRPGDIELVSATASPTAKGPRGKPLPAADDQGTILLTEAGPYEPSDISAVGPLTIKAAPGTSPVILVRGQPLRVWAESLRLEQVQFRFKSEDASEPIPAALLLINAQTLDLNGCSFVAVTPAVSSSRDRIQLVKGATESEPTPTAPTLLGWKLLDARDPRGGVATIRNALFSGTGTAVHMASPIRKLTCDNCLKTGSGPLLQLVAGKAEHDLQVVLNCVTLRQSGSLTRWHIPNDWSARHKLQIEATDCVFDLAPAAGSLLEFRGEALRNDWPQLVQVTGEGSLSGEQLSLATWIDRRTNSATSLDSSKLDVSGILAGPFRFSGPSLANPADSAVLDYDAPRRSPNPPGIKSASLPK